MTHPCGPVRSRPIPRKALHFLTWGWQDLSLSGFFFSFVFNKRGRSKGGGSVSGSRTGLLIFPWFSLYYHSFYKLYRKPLFQALAWQFVMWILKFFSFFKHRESPSSTDFPSVNSQTFFFLKQTMKTIHPKEKAICGKKSEAKTCIPSLLTQ